MQPIMQPARVIPMRRDADEASAAKPPPHSVEAEQSVIGSLLLDNAAFDKLAGVVVASDFFTFDNRKIFEAVSDLIGDGMPADPVTVFERLERNGVAEEVGGLSYLTALSQAVPSATHVLRYAELVRDKARHRRLIAACDAALRAAGDAEKPAVALRGIADTFAALEREEGASDGLPPLLTTPQLREASGNVRWLVKHVIPLDACGMFFGASGTFKSFLALDLALHVAHGLPWLGRKTRKAPVIYVAAEGGTGLWRRIEAWHRARRLKVEDAQLYVIPQALDIGRQASDVVRAAKKIGIKPGLVVIDTLSQTFTGEENSATDMAAYLRLVGVAFREQWGCAALVIHHTGHEATERPRGSSTQLANLDFLYGVFRDEKEMLATMTCAKQKDGDRIDDVMFSLSSHDLYADEDGDIVTSLVARHLTSAEEVVTAMDQEQASGRGGKNKLLLSLIQNGQEEAALRKAFYDACDLEKPEAKRQAYFRARAWALKAGFFEVAGGVVITLKRD